MTRLVEIRSYRLRPGAWPALGRLFHAAALPLLAAAAMDVVAFGQSPDDPDAAFLIRAFDDLADRAGGRMRSTAVRPGATVRERRSSPASTPGPTRS